MICRLIGSSEMIQVNNGIFLGFSPKYCSDKNIGRGDEINVSCPGTYIIHHPEPLTYSI